MTQQLTEKQIKQKEIKRLEHIRYKEKDPERYKRQRKASEKRKRDRNIAKGLTRDGKPRQHKLRTTEERLADQLLKEQKKAARLSAKLEKARIKEEKRAATSARIAFNKSPEGIALKKEKAREYQKKFKESNPDYHEKYKEQWRADNPNYGSEHYQENKDVILARIKEYKFTNPDKIRESKRKTHKKRMKNMPEYRALVNMRNRFKKLLRDSNNQSASFSKNFGIDKSGFRDYIATMFTGVMSWDNYGKEWQLDHVVPLSLAKDNRELLIKLNHYKNLQPLTPQENTRKNDSIPQVWPEGVPFSKWELGIAEPWEYPESQITCYI